MGLSLHPQYGGHFSFRGVLVFPDIKLSSDFREMSAPKLLESDEEIIRVIDLLNHHYIDNRYRDFGNPKQKYSDLQLKYFNTDPRKRWQLIAHWFEVN